MAPIRVSRALPAITERLSSESGAVDLELGALLFAALAGLSGLAFLVHLFVRAATSMP
jgi:hypothetical protein